MTFTTAFPTATTSSIFAQMEAVSFPQIGVGVVLVVVLATAALIAKKFLVGDPPWATREEMRIADEVLHDRINALAQERKVSAAKLHDKLEQNISTAAEMKGELKMLNQNVASLNNQFSQWLQNQAKK